MLTPAGHIPNPRYIETQIGVKYKLTGIKLINFKHDKMQYYIYTHNQPKIEIKEA